MTLQETLTAAVADISAHGYDSMERIAYWQRLIREAALREMTPEAEIDKLLKRHLETVFTRFTDHGGYLKTNPGVERFTVERLRPQLRADLHRRTQASIQLIKMNREDAIRRTEQRFSGWATSIPDGGSDSVEKAAVKKDLRKPLASLPYAEKRVAIDQGTKFSANLSATVAEGSGAIAMIWNSRWRVPGYNYRIDHKDRDQKVYAIRGNWALDQGLMNKGAGYTDDMTAPAEEIFCGCKGTYLYHLRDLPDSMRTAKGDAVLEQVRIRIKAG